MHNADPPISLLILRMLFPAWWKDVSVVYLSLALNSLVKIYNLIHSNKNIYYVNKAKYTAEIAKLK